MRPKGVYNQLQIGALKKTIYLTATTLFVFSALLLSAQGGGTPPPPPSASGPIDGAAAGLLVGVAIYGYVRLKRGAKD